MDTNYPRIHNLVEIAVKANLDLSTEQKGSLVELTTFNLRARYPDYKNRFQKKATRPFAEEKLPNKGIQTMAPGKDKQLIYQKIRDYVQTLERSNVPVWRLYLYGSYAKNTYHADSDIDLAVFWDRDDIDGFDEDVLLRKLCWDIDLRIEPHSFARTDFDETDPYIKEIIETGERIL